MSIEITKEEAARRQIELAIDLFIQDKDPIPVHTFTRAGFDILQDLAAKREADSILKSAVVSIKEDKRTEFWKLLRAPSTFLNMPTGIPIVF
ncbi:MAG: hypothetical protein O6934_10500 [SAR324 cluster bacterium]|nr:hypothetical protein [SAR324 cluster bacterium]